MDPLLSKLIVSEPCETPPGESQRTAAGDRLFCNSCDKHVHDLSSMTRTEIEALFASTVSPCVRYELDSNGNVLILRGPPTSPSGWSRKAIVRAVLPLSLAACGTPGDAPPNTASATTANPASIHGSSQPGYIHALCNDVTGVIRALAFGALPICIPEFEHVETFERFGSGCDGYTHAARTALGLRELTPAERSIIGHGGPTVFGCPETE